jgi:hypothetical protein
LPDSPVSALRRPRVHQKFGKDNVVKVGDIKLTLQLDKIGEKRVVDSFVKWM